MLEGAVDVEEFERAELEEVEREDCPSEVE